MTDEYRAPPGLESLQGVSARSAEIGGKVQYTLWSPSRKGSQKGHEGQTEEEEEKQEQQEQLLQKLLAEEKEDKEEQHQEQQEAPDKASPPSASKSARETQSPPHSPPQSPAEWLDSPVTSQPTSVASALDNSEGDASWTLIDKNDDNLIEALADGGNSTYGGSASSVNGPMKDAAASRTLPGAKSGAWRDVAKPREPYAWGAFPPAAFVGNWQDSLGHDIEVTMGKEYAEATLSKPGVKPKLLQIRPAGPFYGWLWNWRCGNGCLDWNRSTASKLLWYTDLGKSSTWTKQAVKSTAEVAT